MTDRIQKLLNMSGVCACGKPHPVSLRTLVMESGALTKVPEVIRGLGDYRRLVMICDDNTYAAAGQTVEALCTPLWQGEGRGFETVCLQTPAQGLHATETVVADVMASMGDCDLLLAVGSGTIHDITRYVATEMSLDFISIPTAASVDGFLSSIAAMTWHGVKRSFPAKPPIVLISDSDVLAAAPYALTASGVGDLLGKYTALFDWRVSHMVTGEYICERVISLEEAALSEVLSCADAVAAGDPKAVETVMYGLVLSGLAMQMVGNSRPASGSEHHVSHLIEMDVITRDNPALHGEKVGVAAALVADKYHYILSLDPSALDAHAYKGLPLDRIRVVFGDRTDEVLTAENIPDPLGEVDAVKMISLWDDIRTLAEKTLPTGDELRRLLNAMGAKVTLTDIDLPLNLWDALWEMSPYVRRRLTFMRLSKLVVPSSNERRKSMHQQIEIGIIGAMKIEVDALKSAMTHTETKTVAGIDFISGDLQGRRVVIAQCGIGKVFAAVCAQTMILTYAPRIIINTGVAGTLTSRLSIGQVALADRLVQHDMDTTALGDPAGLVSGINVVYFPTDPEVTACLAACVGHEGVKCVTGTVASGDQFVSSAAVKARITETFENCVACEMEGASIAHVCYINKTPCAILRAISDGGDEEASDDYPTFCKKAADTAIRVLMRFLGVWHG